MWLISLRDLQYRYRRFLIAIAVTALVFGIAVAIDGIKQTLQAEPADLVASFHADSWVVRRGSSGLFTTNISMPESFSAIGNFTPQGWVLKAWRLSLAGQPASEMIVPFIVLVAMGIVMFAIGAVMFKRRFA